MTDYVLNVLLKRWVFGRSNLQEGEFVGCFRPGRVASAICVVRTLKLLMDSASDGALRIKVLLEHTTQQWAHIIAQEQ